MIPTERQRPAMEDPPEFIEAPMDAETKPTEKDDAWRTEVLWTLKGIHGLLMQLVEVHEPPDRQEPAAVSEEPTENEEPLPTWILTDESVARIEEAIETEQRVRGRAYGG